MGVLLLAFFCVIGAPRLQRRFGTGPTLYVAFTLFAIDLGIMAIFSDKQAVVVNAKK
ncbi:MAG: hypothetical protein H7288_16690 [Kineosporiaceae bacterium]|nr:hypothetical protein [Aeromicrobium sp.]